MTDEDARAHRVAIELGEPCDVGKGKSWPTFYGMCIAGKCQVSVCPDCGTRRHDAEGRYYYCSLHRDGHYYQ